MRSTACPRRSSSRRSSPGWRSSGLGTRKINYKLRDWLFSRQRYWGEPFPILHELDDKGQPTGVIEPLSADELPLRLPELEDYKPTGKPEPPLGKATDWVNVTRNGKRYRRETNTMPQWAGSCWYYLRYIDPQQRQGVLRPGEGALLAAGRPVRRRRRACGAAPALLALLAQGAVRPRPRPMPEPFQKLVNQGMILGEMDYHIRQEVFTRARIAFRRWA